MKKLTVQNLDHIQGEQVKFLADKANCSEDYIRKIMCGERMVKSIKSRQVLKAAKTLNTAIENAQNKDQKDLIIVGEND